MHNEEVSRDGVMPSVARYARYGGRYALRALRCHFTNSLFEWPSCTRKLSLELGIQQSVTATP